MVVPSGYRPMIIFLLKPVGLVKQQVIPTNSKWSMVYVPEIMASGFIIETLSRKKK